MNPLRHSKIPVTYSTLEVVDPISFSTKIYGLDLILICGWSIRTSFLNKQGCSAIFELMGVFCTDLRLHFISSAQPLQPKTVAAAVSAAYEDRAEGCKSAAIFDSGRSSAADSCWANGCSDLQVVIGWLVVAI